jgi:fatty acid desaturase
MTGHKHGHASDERWMTEAGAEDHTIRAENCSQQERTASSGLTASLSGKGILMLWTIAVILFVLWLLGAFAFHVGGGLIHLLLVIAVVVIVFQLITGRRV